MKAINKVYVFGDKIYNQKALARSLARSFPSQPSNWHKSVSYEQDCLKSEATAMDRWFMLHTVSAQKCLHRPIHLCVIYRTISHAQSASQFDPKLHSSPDNWLDYRIHMSIHVVSFCLFFAFSINVSKWNIFLNKLISAWTGKREREGEKAEANKKSHWTTAEQMLGLEVGEKQKRNGEKMLSEHRAKSHKLPIGRH